MPKNLNWSKNPPDGAEIIEAAREIGLPIGDSFAGWSNEALRDYEERLYDEEVFGADIWYQRDQVLWEMNRRGMMDDVKVV